MYDESTPTSNTDHPAANRRSSCPSKVSDLGIYLDADLVMRTHVQHTVLRCFAALRRLRQIRRSMPPDTFQSLIESLVISRLDYGNAIPVGLPVYLVRRLQSVLNAAARLIYHMRSVDHVTDALISLHWLRATQQIEYKVAVLTYTVLHGSAPQYLGPLVPIADLQGRRTLRSANTGTSRLVVPSVRLSTVGRQVPLGGFPGYCFTHLEVEVGTPCQRRLRQLSR